MSTDSQFDANRANAQKSCGPKTEAGKAISCRNHLSHGFASNTRFIPGEDPTEFCALLDDLKDEHLPATPTEHILVEKMAHNQWIGLRAIRIQGDVMARMRVMSDVHTSLPLLIRYQTAADRAFHKAHTELVKTQKQRGTAPIGFESKKAGQASEPAPQAPKTAAEAPKATPKSPVPPAEPQKKAPPAPVEPATITFEEEIEWVMNASIEEMMASGL